MENKLSFTNTLEEVPRIAEFVEQIAEEAGCDMKTLSSLQLAIEELSVNVINYAYPKGHQGIGSIEASVKDGRLTIVMRDQGVAFDPTAQAAPDLDLDPMARPIGGLGIFLVRKIMDSVTYRRDGEINELTLTKNI